MFHVESEEEGVAFHVENEEEGVVFYVESEDGVKHYLLRVRRV